MASRPTVFRDESAHHVQVTNISSHGFWLLSDGSEYFVAFVECPWFRQARIEQILAVELPAPGHFYWPELDVDLHVDILSHPERFQLVAKG